MAWQVKILILIMAVVWIAAATAPDGKLHVVFCDVGQGNAVLISQGFSQTLVDGGPGEEVMRCLSRHVPFYDRRIETVVLSHNQKDHAEGLKSVLKRYSVKYFVWDGEGNLDDFKSLMKQTRVQLAERGTSISMGEEKLAVVWPSKESRILGASTNVNESGLVGVLQYGNFRVMLPADVGGKTLREAGADGKVDVLLVPHHGSKYAADRQWIANLGPKLAVISVGKNSYGHPSSEALGLLEEAGARIMRTDRDGDVEVISDGKSWRVVQDH